MSSTELPPTTPVTEVSANIPARTDSAFPENEKQGPPVQASTSIKPLAGAYKVLPARAYFHSSPDVSSSTGKYVLRGDIVYAEGESGNFIKTRYFNSAGDPVAGWLKKTEVQLTKAAAKPALPRATPTSPRRPTPEPAVARTQTKKPAVASSDSEPKETPVSASRKPATTGTVRVDTTYFYDSPDLTQRRRAFCIRGDKMTLTDSSEQAVFATFINWEKVKTTGWIRKEDLNIR
ncbi:hypothetical protein H9L05_00355 [Hymenobacter qilianensis]|uniref:SH3 domain-containing protein n=1 Tax=Hymenobacter qilianensis TaxID=1385715 RepID=A0A7H0GVJ6_9BACT|nr:hypothetical protein [Hymenobacter qilianensis]QNP52312.1 hypothetical protein H9L05_00355 [Hymenobacter qilianensis]